MPNPSLPDDALAEILSYLPCEITANFRRVSKSWRRLISHHHFTSLQQRRWADRALGFFHWGMLSRRGVIHFEPLPTSTAAASLPLLSSINSKLAKFPRPILASSNGMFLSGSYTELLVWDPITKACIRIPQPSGLVCDPDSSMLFGLAASPITKSSFQIVAVSTFPSSSSIFIYSSESRSWTAHKMEMYVFANDLNPGGPAVVGGSLYWLQYGSILAFDLGSRRVRVIKLPRDGMFFGYATGVYLNVWLGGFGGNLYFVYVSKKKDIEFWRLKRCDDKEEHWEKVTEDKSDRLRAPLFFDGRRIAFSTFGVEWEKDWSKIELYDTWTREWQGSINCSAESADDDFFDVYHCFAPYYL